MSAAGSHSHVGIGIDVSPMKKAVTSMQGPCVCQLRDYKGSLELIPSILADELTSLSVFIFYFMLSAGVASLKSEGERWIP